MKLKKAIPNILIVLGVFGIFIILVSYANTTLYVIGYALAMYILPLGVLMKIYGIYKQTK